MYDFYIEKNIRTEIDGYAAIARLYKEVHNQKDISLRINFSHCIHFDANLASVLGALIDLLIEEGYKVWITRPLYTGVRRILSRNQFLKAFQIDTSNEDRETFIPYRKFSQTESDDFKKYIDDELISKQKFPKHTELVGRNINESIFEIYVNAITHGSSKSVYCCGEYKPDVEIPRLDVTIVDCGNTIYKNVCDYCIRKGLDSLNSFEAIEWAIQEGNTTKESTGGLGLSLIKDFIDLNKGLLQIKSSDGFWEYENGKVNSRFMENIFPGTIINMEFNFNDDKFYYMSEEKEALIDPNDLL